MNTRQRHAIDILHHHQDFLTAHPEVRAAIGDAPDQRAGGRGNRCLAVRDQHGVILCGARPRGRA